jgi:hypothetical protein
MTPHPPTPHRRSFRLPAIFAALAFATMACTHNPVVEYNGVRVEVKKGSGLLVTNHTNERLGVYAADQIYDSQYPFTRCADVTDGCLRLAIGGSLLIPFADVPGYQPRHSIAIYTWTVDNGVITEVSDIAIAAW